MSIIGFDDIPFSAVTMPALTTMRISRSAMGMLAVDMIRKRIKYPDWPGMHMLIGGKLIVRPSGTEPKIKLYVNVNDPDQAKAQALLEHLTAEAQKLLK